MRPLIVGHRGASASAPENTIAAFKMALDAGADGIEFDVRLSRDGVPVVIHDADLRRVAGRSEMVSKMTAKELGDTDVGSWFNRAFPGRARGFFSSETVPFLTEVLEMLTDREGPIYLELKTDSLDFTELVHRCCSLIQSSPVRARVIVKSFDLTAIEQVKVRLPAVETAALFEPSVKAVFRRRSELVARAVGSGATQISLHWSLANRKLVESARVHGMPVTVWTVDHPRWVARARWLDIGSLITNDPGRLLDARSQLHTV